MSIQKFKTNSDAREALWKLKPDAAYYRRMEDFYNTVDRMAPRRKVVRGITFLKTFEDLVAVKEKSSRR